MERVGVFPSAMNPQLMHPVNYAHKILRFALDRLDRQDNRRNNVFRMTKLSIILCSTGMLGRTYETMAY